MVKVNNHISTSILNRSLRPVSIRFFQFLREGKIPLRARSIKDMDDSELDEFEVLMDEVEVEMDEFEANMVNYQNSLEASVPLILGHPGWKIADFRPPYFKLKQAKPGLYVAVEKMIYVTVFHVNEGQDGDIVAQTGPSFSQWSGVVFDYVGFDFAAEPRLGWGYSAEDSMWVMFKRGEMRRPVPDRS